MFLLLWDHSKMERKHHKVRRTQELSRACKSLHENDQVGQSSAMVHQCAKILKVWKLTRNQVFLCSLGCRDHSYRVNQKYQDRSCRSRMSSKPTTTMSKGASNIQTHTWFVYIHIFAYARMYLIIYVTYVLCQIKNGFDNMYKCTDSVCPICKIKHAYAAWSYTLLIPQFVSIWHKQGGLAQLQRDNLLYYT